jgi:hypothetical protein
MFYLNFENVLIKNLNSEKFFYSSSTCTDVLYTCVINRKFLCVKHLGKQHWGLRVCVCVRACLRVCVRARAYILYCGKKR